MKVFISDIKESWIVDRFREEWYIYNPEISTEKIRKADIIWTIAPWELKNFPKRQYINKKVICTIHHLDFDKFDSIENDRFMKLDKFIDEYHTISEKSFDQLSSITSKKINVIPFWVNQNLWFEKLNKKKIREDLGFSDEDYLIGSFQRDTEGKDLKSPKLIKGPDIFIEAIEKIYKEKNNLKVVLAGKRRQYVIKKLEEKKIPYVYFEMIDLDKLNNLYNILDLYIVSSRVEGGPQAIFECAASKTPIISTDVGIASEILKKKSIYNLSEINLASPDVEYAYKNVKQYFIPEGMSEFQSMFKRVYEN